jgi:hypothetical protein
LRRYRLFASGISVAMLLGGAAAPTLANPSNSGRISGSGRTANVANFSIQVRQDKLWKGHFKYTSVDGRFKVRCDGFDSYSPRMYFAPGPPAAMVTADCVLTGPRNKRTPIALEAEFVDNNSFKRGTKNEANLTFTYPDQTKVTDSGPILSGDVTVR